MVGTIETYAKPDTLYRYRSFGGTRVGDEWLPDPDIMERELTAIEDGYIYCPRYTDMNDPMEGLYKASPKVQAREDYDEFAQRVRDQKLQLGIASLSETWDNELMWAHYAGQFSGICVGYSLSKLLASLPAHCALARVAYGDRPFYLNLAAMRTQDEKARAILSTKNFKWSYEREWRLFAEASGPAGHRRDAVSRVYLGVRMSDPLISRIARRLRRNGISVYRTAVDGYSIRRRGAKPTI